MNGVGSPSGWTSLVEVGTEGDGAPTMQAAISGPEGARRPRSVPGGSGRHDASGSPRRAPKIASAEAWATAHEAAPGGAWSRGPKPAAMVAEDMADRPMSCPRSHGEPAVDMVAATAEESYVAEAHADDAPQRRGSGVRRQASATETVGAAAEAEQRDAEGGSAPEARDIQGPPRRRKSRSIRGRTRSEHEEEHVEQIGGDALSDAAPRPVRLRRHYKIQEVIKRRQILLIQVVKEERGNKGAALTTYLSLAGRYSVLMPNTAKGGGISRKITDGEDRKRLKAIAGELDVPEGMGVILRTAGASRTPVEVRRDFEYLLRMWESVRELTLKSSAPALVYEEGSLIKRSIRDLYSKEVEEIVVSGEAGFAEARDFMRMLMPGNVKSRPRVSRSFSRSSPSPAWRRSSTRCSPPTSR